MCARWKFLPSAKAIRKQEFHETLPRALVQDFGVLLMGAGYEVSMNLVCVICVLMLV